MQESDIHITSGELHDANINRSPSAYLHNPESERAKYKFNTEHDMTVLRLDTVDGNHLGVITWFPVHLTSMNRTNLLINADNKGRASMLFERMMRRKGEDLTGKVEYYQCNLFIISSVGVTILPQNILFTIAFLKQLKCCVFKKLVRPYLVFGILKSYYAVWELILRL